MKGKDLIKLIIDNDLQDYEIKVSHSYADSSDWGYAVDTYEIFDLSDIGHSDKVALIGVVKVQ